MSKKGILKAATLGLMAFSSGEASAQAVEAESKKTPQESTLYPMKPETEIPTSHIHAVPVPDILEQLGIQPGSENMSHPDINTVRHKRAEQDLLTACRKFCFDMDNLHKSYLNDNELMIYTESSFMVGNLKDNKGIGISDDGILYGKKYSYFEDQNGGQGVVGLTDGAQEVLKDPDMSRYVSYYRHLIENSEDSALVKGAQPFLQQLNKQYPETEEKVESSTLGLDNPNNPFYHAAKESWFSND